MPEKEVPQKDSTVSRRGFLGVDLPAWEDIRPGSPEECTWVLQVQNAEGPLLKSRVRQAGPGPPGLYASYHLPPKRMSGEAPM